MYPTQAGDYLLYARIGGHTLFAGDVLSADDAQGVRVVAGQTTYVTFHFPATGEIAGHLDLDPGFPSDRHADIDAYAIDPVGRLVPVADGVIYPDGRYWISDVPVGDVVVRASVWHHVPGRGFVTLQHQYAGGTRSWFDADKITVTAGSTTGDIDFSLAPQVGGPEIVRMGGADRYATAVQVSRTGIPDEAVGAGVSAVFIASGSDFPDALSIAPAAAGEGPVLQVDPVAIPPVVQEELVRLTPEQIIVVVGGAVSPGVGAALDAYAPVTRISGSDRYATSRAVVRAFFGDGASVAVIASGDNFPDALSAGAYAGAIGAPVILIDPGRGTLDPDTTQLLADLGVSHLYVMGGTGAIPLTIAAQLAALPGVDFLRRVGGADRFATSAAMPGVQPDQEVFLANGYGFADALAGTWLAATYGARVALATPDCTPSPYLLSYRAESFYVLGQTGAVPDCKLGL